jgi:hypothetical protein
MTAAEYKKHIKRHLYAKNYGGAVEESVNHWNADIIGVNFKGETNEFEIKVSVADLKGEIKAINRALQGGIYKSNENQRGLWSYNRVEVEEKVSLTKLEKHYCYLVGPKMAYMTFTGTAAERDRLEPTDDTRSCFVPSKFYFTVPTEMVELAKELLKKVPYYGVMNADTGEIKKAAKLLPRRNIRSEDYLNLFMRACTEWRDDINRVAYLEHIEKNGHNIYVHRPNQYSWGD